MSLRILLLAVALSLGACPRRVIVTSDATARADSGSTQSDASPVDAVVDAGASMDAERIDAEPIDAGFFDAQATDAQATDAQATDVVATDAPVLDATHLDAAALDADPPEVGLDPDLALPDPSGEVCTYPGDLGACPGIAVCRFYTPAEGRCESCSPCGNLNDFCTLSSECDILFSCYQGRCTNFCTLGTQACGPVEDCIDIGHPTRGVCRP